MKRRFRIGLRLLLLVITLCVVCFAWLAERSRFQHAELEITRISLQAEIEADAIRRKSMLQPGSGQVILPANQYIAGLKQRLARLPK